MIAGFDSAYPPPDPVLRAAQAAGLGLWAGYFAGPNILNGWAKPDFDRVRAAGLATFAYCSGWSNPDQMKAQSEAWGVPICLDVEGAIRGFGAWMVNWLAVSGAGLYGNPPVHRAVNAAFHILAIYPGYDPGAAWSGARPPTPCGWQFEGTHVEFGVNVDRGWYDDWFVTFGIELQDMTPEEHQWLFNAANEIRTVLTPAVEQLQQDVAALKAQVASLSLVGGSTAPEPKNVTGSFTGVIG